MLGDKRANRDGVRHAEAHHIVGGVYGGSDAHDRKLSTSSVKIEVMG